MARTSRSRPRSARTTSFVRGNAIKTAGTHNIEVNFYRDINAVVSVLVGSDEQEAEEAEEAETAEVSEETAEETAEVAEASETEEAAE